LFLKAFFWGGAGGKQEADRDKHLSLQTSPWIVRSSLQGWNKIILHWLLTVLLH